MLKNRLCIGCFAFVTLFLFQVRLANAQMVGSNYYIQGSYIEIGINGDGGFEGVSQSISPPPAGYHARGTFLPFGFIADPLMDSWTLYDGDFYTPGTPENGWGIEIGTDGTNANNNYVLSGDGFNTPDVPGRITRGEKNGDCINVDWEGQDTIGGTNLHIKINYFLQVPDLYYTTTVYITNNTSTNIPDMYYYRSLDPDNNVELSGDYSTTNTIVSEPTSGDCDLAHVSATSNLPADAHPLSYIGLAGVGDNFRVTYGGFSNRDASDIWYGTGYTASVGSSDFGDEAISLAYRIQDLAPGATASFRYVTILASSGAAHAINNLLHLSYIGSESLPPAACRADTVRTCGAPVNIGVSGPATADFTWSWSPGTGLSSTTDPSVIATPGVTTSYTITGTPVSACASVPVEILITIEVTPAGGPAPVITPPPVLCEGDPLPTLTADQPGYFYPGYVADSLGHVQMGTPGTYEVYFRTSAVCNNLDSTTITILPAHVTILQPPVLCIGSAPVTLLATAPGGTWSGTGITDPTLGTYDQNTVVGNTTYVIDYTVAGVCPLHDTVVVTVDSVPVAKIAHIPDVCISSPSFNLSARDAGGTWDGDGITNATFGTFHPSSAGLGPHWIYYMIDGPCGKVTDSVIVNVISIYNTTITTPPSPCENASSFSLSAYTPGGVWGGPGITDGVAGIFDPSSAGAGVHQIDYTIYGVCGSHDTALVNVLPIPVADFTIAPATVVAPNMTVSFNNTSTGSVSWSWDFGDTLSGSNSSTLQSPTHVYANVGTYCVLLTATNTEGCTDTTRYCLLVTGESTIKVPNVFTPNGDGKNDVFYFETLGIKDLKCTIYDRWGVKVNELNGLGESNGWKGDNKGGKAVSDGTYFYMIEATGLEDNIVKQQGFVQLIKDKQ